ncbi:MAG: minichromosome maintenance protein MCM [Euryarchaeota archaeon]|nr:minichromosome maintenance protein MCM [Euryarchaeota archaeon]
METKGYNRYTDKQSTAARFPPQGGHAMIQEFDLPARWRSFLEEYMSEEINALAMMWPKLRSLSVEYHQMETFDPNFAVDLLEGPARHQDASETALRLLLQESGNDLPAFVRVSGLPSDHSLQIKELRADHIGKMVGLESIVTKISGVRPRIHEAVFRCAMCNFLIFIKQPNEQELIEPIECPTSLGGCNKNKRDTRFFIVEKKSTMINSQFIEIQEPPEKLRGGTQPQRLLAIAEHDVAGVLNPGDRVTVNGELFVRSQRKAGRETPIFDIFLRVLSLERQNIPLEEVNIQPEDEKIIKEISKRDGLYDLMKGSIAPSIFGFPRIKESLLLQLFGGVARKNSDGNRNRGDIHILLMGDPGVAKSQLLNYMSNLSPRGRFTSGMSASAAGLTAAAVQDASADGRWTLEAGVLALADQGLAAIDEFDKMTKNDRSSMHEAMEQQRISISKAGINATLSTRCAVLAAANPKSGRFDPVSEVPFTSQVNMGPPLLSRFDIIWLITDNPVEEDDRRIASHIISNRLAGISEQRIEEGLDMDPSEGAEIEGMSRSHDGSEILGQDLFRKYVAYAKRNINPIIDEDARQLLTDYYVETRRLGGESRDSVSITARALEALVRLTEAGARVRLSNKATTDDADRAIRITRTWRYKLMGDSFDETTMQSGVKATKRNTTQELNRFIREEFDRTQKGVEMQSILNFCEQNSIETGNLEDILEREVRDGRLFMPTYGVYGPAN